MREKLEPMLGEFGPRDITAGFCGAIFSAVPFAPAFPPYRSIEDAAKVVWPAARPEHLARAKELSLSEPTERALWTAAGLDTGDKGIAVYTGLKTAFNLFFAPDKKKSFEADPQQAADAALKAMGLAFMVDKLLPGTVEEKVALFKKLPAGQSLVLYYTAVEVAVPFTDEVLASATDALATLLERAGKDSGSRLMQLAGATAMQEAKGVQTALLPALEAVLGKVVQYVGPMVEKAKVSIPGLLQTSDKVSGAVATGADILPVWRLLGSRLAAEACVLRAVYELDGKDAVLPPPPPPPVVEAAPAAVAPAVQPGAAASVAAPAPAAPSPVVPPAIAVAPVAAAAAAVPVVVGAAAAPVAIAAAAAPPDPAPAAAVPGAARESGDGRDSH